MRRPTRLVLRFAAGLLGLAACGGQAPQEPGAGGLAVGDILGGVPAAGFARVVGPRPFAFPADHGAHPEFRNEWWYLTGNLEDTAGRPFGYQLTIFRNSLRPPDPAVSGRGSAWATEQVYLGHLAVSDPVGDRFVARERLRRGALGLAGAESQPFRVWIDRWRFESAGEELFPLQVVAVEPEAAIELVLSPQKPLVLQGDRGFSAKGAEPGNASHYYSFPRLATRGTLTLGGERFAVMGSSWLDREWGTSALGQGVVGWDWLALQLDDGRELMAYRLRRADGSADPASSATLIASDGGTRRFGADAFELQALSSWRAPDGLATYPARLRVRLPAERLELEVEPLLADQELRLAVRYWEGAVRAHGTVGGQAVTARGYLELTGYARARAASAHPESE